MNHYKLFISILVLALAFSNCRRPPTEAVPPSEPVAPSFLFANDDGQLRIFNVQYTDDLDTLFAITRYTTLGAGNFEFGQVDIRKEGTYDWGRFSPNQDPRAVAITWRENIFQPTHKTDWDRRYVEVGSFERLRQMGFYSEINQRRQELRQFNYYRGANAVSFVNHRFYLALYTDRYDPASGAPKPNLPIGDRKTSLLLFDLQAAQPNQPEIIATLFHDDYMNRFPATFNWMHNIRRARVGGSANAEFFFIWTKAFNTWGSYPWVFRFDGTTAYNPIPQGNQQYARVPAQESFALDLHPTRDSLLVVSDRHPQYEGTFILRVPQADRRPFEIIAELPFSDYLPEIPTVYQKQAYLANKYYVKFNQKGDKVAIITSLDGMPPHVTVWNWQEGTHRRYLINSENSGYFFDEVGDAGWELHAEDDLFFFLAGDSSRDAAYFHYINASDENQTHARIILWDDIEFRDMPPEEPLHSVKELKQRKAY